MAPIEKSRQAEVNLKSDRPVAVGASGSLGDGPLWHEAGNRHLSGRAHRELREKIRSGVQLFKSTVRPIMINSRVYHHTPLAPMLEPSPWIVLEYATPDAARAAVGLFRTSQDGDPVFRFIPRGLDLGRSYRVTFHNRGQILEIPEASFSRASQFG
jgi:hypothetical protein